MRVHRSVQIGGDNCERTLHIVDQVALARIDVADQNAPMPVSSGIGGFSPEAQNENLIGQRSL
jgi:hypothetical protein